MRLVVFSLVILAGCTQAGSEPKVSATGDASVAVLPKAPPAPAPDASEETHFFPSRRCGECHGRARDEWAASAHARSAGGVFAQVAQKLGEEATVRCQGCHVPLAAGEEQVSSEGVSCDACHTAVRRAQPPAALVLAPELATRFGPYRDANAHYFHKVAYSDFVVEGALCASCHQDPPGQKVPEYTTVAEWRDVADHVDCQTCHMPGLRDRAARGEKIRSVSRHGFSSDKAKALAEALKLSVQVSHGEAQVGLTNAVADHDLPTGRPERRLKVSLDWMGKDGKPVAHQEHFFGRMLVDADGAPSPSFLAVREAQDDRLHPGETWHHTFPRVEGARSLSVRLEYFRFDPALSAFFGPVAPVKVAEREEAL